MSEDDFWSLTPRQHHHHLLAWQDREMRHGRLSERIFSDPKSEKAERCAANESFRAALASAIALGAANRRTAPQSKIQNPKSKI